MADYRDRKIKRHLRKAEDRRLKPFLMQVMQPLTYSDIEGVLPDKEELISKLALLNRKKTILFLAMVNMLISLYEKNGMDFVRVQGTLFKSLCSEELINKINTKFGSEHMGEKPLFYRQQVLTLMKWCLVHCPEERGFDLTSKEQGRCDLGTVALMMSNIINPKERDEKLKYEEQNEADAKRAEEELVAQLSPVVELYNPPDIMHSFVRNAEYFRIFARQAEEGKLLFKNRKTLHCKFEEIAGLKLDDYLRMIMAVVIYYLIIGEKSPEALINDTKLFNIDANIIFSKMNYSSETVRAFFNLTTLSIEALGERIKLGPPEEYDFTVLRMYPMVYTRESKDIMACCDAGFLMEKTVNGVYFTIHNSLKGKSAESKEDEDDHRSFMGFWGAAFEHYVNDRLWEYRYGPDLRDFYPIPQFTIPPCNKITEAFDAVLDYKSKLVVMEHKGKFVRIKARCSGDRAELLKEFTEKDIVGKAVVQIAKNLGFIFNNQPGAERHTFYANEGERIKTYDLREINRVSCIYPVIVHQDFFLRLNGITQMARKFFEEELAKHPIDPRLVRPLTLITIEDLETLVPYLRVKPLPVILERYFSSKDPYDTFENFFHKFLKQDNIKIKRNVWIDQRSEEMWDEIQATFVNFSEE